MAEFYGFRPDIGGIRAALKSDGVQSALRAIVEPIASSATGIAAANADSHTRGAEYKAYVDVGNYTAIGKVVCGNAAARHDNAHNNTILKAR
jgi:hypothetical protein